MRKLNELENKIGYHFSDFSNLEHAMRHSSFCNEQKMNRLMNNERLEFLGDAVLELVTSEFLYLNYRTHADAGRKTYFGGLFADLPCCSLESA